MARDRKLIVILIDGLSADYFQQNASRLPALAALAAGGISVTRLRSPVPATSMPGRASMLTGKPSQDHGIFGNHIFDGTTFRCATPNDVAVPTIARRAKDEGLDVACIGHAMVRPEDTDLFQPAWWQRGWMNGSRFAKVLNDAEVASLLTVRDALGRLGTSAGEAEDVVVPEDPSLDLINGMACDDAIVRTVAGLACSDAPPDLILTEIAMPDHVQHDYGYESRAAHWSLATADLLVGFLVQQIQQAGRQDDFAFAIASDHGHSPIETAIYPDVVLPGMLWETEGSTLHVAVRDKADRGEADRRLAAFGVETTESTHVPEALRSRVATYIAPPGHAFEETPAAWDDGRPTGQPAYISSHGLKPGTPADDRFCVFAGAGIPAAVVPSAAAEQFCPTLAAILGLPDTDGDNGLL